MRAGDLLRRLDSRLLPPLATGMARLGQGRLRLRVLTGAALVSVTAVLLTAVWAADRPQVGDPTVGAVVRVGVGDGQSIPGYVEAARGELAALAASSPDQQTYALVSLSAYLAPQRLAPVLRGLAVSQVYGRVQLPETQTQIVRIPAQRLPDDVTAGMAVVAGKKEAEASDYRELSRKLTGQSGREQDLRQVYDSGAAIAAAEAEAYRSGCSCVYAAVVRATPGTLGRISGRPEVRAVDPAPEVTRLDRAVFLPPLPEQRELVRPPADAGVPTDPPSEPAAAPPPAQTPTPEPSSSPPTAEPTLTATPASSPPTAEPSGSAPASEPSATPT